MIRLMEFFYHSRKFALICGLIVLLVLAASGCVDINDARVQVLAPGQVDPYSRIGLDKCPSHVYPHRLILGQTGSSSPLAQVGPQMINNQRDFDKYWGYVTAIPNDKISTASLSQQPLVNWEQQMVYFIVIATNNTCEKSKPMPDEMTTDCYTVTIPLYRYFEGTDCQPPGFNLVFIYLFPKTPLPVNFVWFYPTPVPTPTPKPIPTPTFTPTPTPLPESEDE